MKCFNQKNSKKRQRIYRKYRKLRCRIMLTVLLKRTVRKSGRASRVYETANQRQKQEYARSGSEIETMEENVMKKIFVMFLALMLVLSLTACRTNDKGTDIDFDAIFEGKSDIKLTSLSESEQQAIIDAGEASGVKVVFTGIDDDVIFTRLSDGYNAAWMSGSWSFWSDSDIKPAEWPDDEFTRLIPKPDFDLFTTNTYENTFTAIFKNVTLDQIKAYTESVKTAGFTVSQKLDENTAYRYTASNGKGYSIELTRYASSDQTVYLIITKE